MNEKILNAVKEARSSAKKRKFSQSFDLMVNLKLLNPKKPENRISEVVALPNGMGRMAKIVIFSDAYKNDNHDVYTSDDIGNFAANKRSLKKLTKSTDFFLADPKLMVNIGKNLGVVLAPQGKMPTPMVGEPKQMISKYEKSVRLKIKDSPVIQCLIGTEDMKDEDITENIEYILNFLEGALPKGRNNIGTVMVKLTMGKPVKVEV